MVDADVGAPRAHATEREMRDAVGAADLWILQQCKDMREGADRHSARRLIAAAESAGLRAAVVHPRWIDVAPRPRSSAGIELRIDGRRVRPPLAALSRSGVKLTRRGLGVLKALEALRVLCAPSVASYHGARDKLTVARRLCEAGVPTPTTVELRRPLDVAQFEAELGFPVVLKNAIGSRGEQVALCRDWEDLPRAVAIVAGKGPVIAQRFVAASRGRDIRAFVVGGRLVATMLRRLGPEADPAEFRSNIALGGVGAPFVPCAEATRIAEQAASALRLDIAGVDLLFDGAGFTVCEVNMSPSLAAIERVTGKDVAAEIIAILRARLDARRAA